MLGERTSHVPMRERIVLLYVDANAFELVRAVFTVDAPVRVVVVVDGATSVCRVDNYPPVFARYGSVDSL
jgi:hypothetical protein